MLRHITVVALAALAGIVCSRVAAAEFSRSGVPPLESGPATAATAPAPPANAGEALSAVLLNVVELPTTCNMTPVVRTLLAKGADPNWRGGKNGRAPLHGLADAAAYLWSDRRPEDWQDAAALLLKAGADVNQRTADAGRSTPLHLLVISAGAVEGGRPANLKTAYVTRESVAFLLRHGADPSARDADGKTPLDRVGEWHESPLKDQVAGLLKDPPEVVPADAGPAAGPAVSLDPKAAAAALNEAAAIVIQYPPDNAALLIEYLLEAGADPRVEAGNGSVLLNALAFSAAIIWSNSHNDWRRAAEVLLKAGADINGKGPDGGMLSGPGADGATPLVAAVASAALMVKFKDPRPIELGMARFLLDHGADPSIRNGQGKTALDLAEEIEDEQVRRQLVEVLRKNAK